MQIQQYEVTKTYCQDCDAYHEYDMARCPDCQEQLIQIREAIGLPVDAYDYYGVKQSDFF